MVKTATIGEPCAFNFTYGPRRTIEYLTGLRIVMPGDRGSSSVAPAPASHPLQAVRENQDRQNTLGPRIEDPRLANAGRQVMDILHNYAHDHAANLICRGVRQGTLLFANAPGGLPVARPSNVSHSQNPPASDQGPPPATAQPPDTGRPRAEEIDMLRQFSNGLRFAPRPITVGHPQQPGRYGGLPLTSAPPNISTGFTAINTGSAGPSVGAGSAASAAARAGWEGRRRCAAPDRGHSAGRADSTTSRVGASRRRRATPLTDSNALAASGSSADDGVPANRLADATGAAHAHQALAVTSTTARLPLPEGLHRVNRSGKNIMTGNASNVTNPANGTFTGLDATHTAVSAGNVLVTASNSSAVASGGGDNDAKPAAPSAESEGGGANTSAIAERVTQGASTGEDVTRIIKVEDTNGADVLVTAQDTNSASTPAALAPGESTSNATVPVNSTAESGSESGHSPPHKKQKVGRGHSGGTAGDNVA